MTTASLQTQIHDYQAWRDTLSQTISEYRSWLNATNTIEPIQELRLFDLQEMLQKDQLVLAFLAEFSRGKTETINALFFSDFKQRLLPSEPGRTTMCPTEIFWDEREEPCIKLLPIETRLRDDALVYLKTTPVAWRKVRLDLNSPEDMREALRTLTQQKEVSREAAQKLGLWDEADSEMASYFASTGFVQIPMWRHALINYPHPLLKNGLVIIDTPGLNSLGAEPELTLNIIPKAQAVVFMTATDTGVTKSDMQIWKDYIRQKNNHKIVILNKIDTLWDEIRPQHEIDKLVRLQVENTAKTLGIPSKNVYAMSAQKALVAKFRNDKALLERSGIIRVEEMIAKEMVASKQEVLGRTIAMECGVMIKTSRRLAQARVENAKAELYEMLSLQEQTRSESKAMLAKVIADRKRYLSSEQTFNIGSDKIKRLGEKMLRHLSITHLELSIKQSRQQIGDSWTTISLNRGMRSLAKEAYLLAAKITDESKTIKKLADDLYRMFQVKHGFEVFEAPTLNMANFIGSMQELEKITDEFCTDPINIMTEKYFLVRRFFMGIGAQTQSIFEQAHKECSLWLHNVLNVLKIQIDEHKASLERRTQALMQAQANTDLQGQSITQLRKELSLLQAQSNALDAMLLKILKAARGDEGVDENDVYGFSKAKQQVASSPFGDAPLLDLGVANSSSR